MRKFIPNIHAYIRAGRATRRGASARPDEVARGLHKEYPRMPRIILPPRGPLTLRLDSALSQRTSFHTARSNRGFASSDLSTLLGHTLGMRNSTLRHYPSGGALYPIETYIVGAVLEGQPHGVYHYHPSLHALEHLWDLQSWGMADLSPSAATPLSRTLILFTAVWERNAIKYGDFAYNLALLEAGHMAQNVLLAGTALGIQARPVGGVDDALAGELLDLHPQIEQPVYAMVVAPPAHPGKEIETEIFE